MSFNSTIQGTDSYMRNNQMGRLGLCAGSRTVPFYIKNMTAKTALIWLIDDNEIDNFIAASVIKRLPDAPEVIAFTDPQKALSELDAILSDDLRLPTIILLDLNMPKLSGFEFADRLRELPFGDTVPDIYMLSSSADRSDIQRSEEHEFIKSYIIKPFTSRHLDIILGSAAEGQ